MFLFSLLLGDEVEARLPGTVTKRFCIKVRQEICKLRGSDAPGHGGYWECLSWGWPRPLRGGSLGEARWGSLAGGLCRSSPSVRTLLLPPRVLSDRAVV